MLPVPLREMVLRKLNSKSKQYSKELRKFAMMLHFYSPRAYAFLRKSLCNILPSPSTIRQWCCSSNFEPGFSKEVLETLQRREKTVICTLMVDEMSIWKQEDYKHNKWYGFVNTNVEVANEDQADHTNAAYAKSALTFILVAMNDNFKVPMGYFLIDTLDRKECANLVRAALVLAEQHGVHIHGLTFDGAPVNGSMAKDLGADLDKNEPYIIHPITLERVYCFPDPTHMIKNARNALGETAWYYKRKPVSEEEKATRNAPLKNIRKVASKKRGKKNTQKSKEEILAHVDEVIQEVSSMSAEDETLLSSQNPILPSIEVTAEIPDSNIPQPGDDELIEETYLSMLQDID